MSLSIKQWERDLSHYNQYFFKDLDFDSFSSYFRQRMRHKMDIFTFNGGINEGIRYVFIKTLNVFNIERRI